MVGVSSVLDFGGACGTHYKRAALQSPNVRWAVVETPAMAARASSIETDRLRFFTSVARDCLSTIDLMHSNGTLQYVPNPRQTLTELCGLDARTMLWDRVFLSETDDVRESQTSHLIDNGPGAAPRGILNKTVKYSRTAIPRSAFLAAPPITPIIS